MGIQPVDASAVTQTRTDTAILSSSLPSISKSSTEKLTIKKIDNEVEKMLQSDMTPEEYCVKAGISLLEVYKTLGNIALKAVITAKDKYGDVIELGADNRARMSAIALILELNKHIKDKNIVTQVGIFNDPSEVQRVLGLRARI